MNFFHPEMNAVLSLWSRRFSLLFSELPVLMMTHPQVGLVSFPLADSRRRASSIPRILGYARLRSRRSLCPQLCEAADF